GRVRVDLQVQRGGARPAQVIAYRQRSPGSQQHVCVVEGARERVGLDARAAAAADGERPVRDQLQGAEGVTIAQVDPTGVVERLAAEQVGGAARCLDSAAEIQVRGLQVDPCLTA